MSATVTSALRAVAGLAALREAGANADAAAKRVAKRAVLNIMMKLGKLAIM